MESIKLSELVENETINQLVPEMTEKEFLDLKTSVSDNGLRHPIDINKDNTILDGRHRVRVFKSLGYESIPFTRHDLSESEAISFVRDTAVERRHLTDAQRLNIILNSEDVIAEIVERAKESKKQGVVAGGKARHSAQGSAEPKAEIPTNTNEVIGKLAGVSRATVNRAKKVRRENPEAYEKVVKGYSTWSKEFDNLPSVQESRAKKSTGNKPPVEKTKPKKEDLRDVINNQSKCLTEADKRLMRAETEAMNISEKSLALHNQIEEIKDMELFIRFIKTLDKNNLVEAYNSLEKIINMEDFKND